MTEKPTDAELQTATDQVIGAAEKLASTLRHSSRNLEMATSLLLMLLAEPEPSHDTDAG
jgi:hypothetical protein